MENIVTAQGRGATENHETKWVNNSDPHFPCNKIQQEFEIQYQCYQMQTSWMLTLFKYDFEKVISECQKSRKDMILVCFRSLGRDTAGHTLRNPQKILMICNKVPNRFGYFDECISGADNVIVDFWGSKLRDQAASLCRMLPEESKKLCYIGLTNRLHGIFSNQAQIIQSCQYFEDKFKNLCI